MTNIQYMCCSKVNWNKSALWVKIFRLSLLEFYVGMQANLKKDTKKETDTKQKQIVMSLCRSFLPWRYLSAADKILILEE